MFLIWWGDVWKIQKKMSHKNNIGSEKKNIAVEKKLIFFVKFLSLKKICHLRLKKYISPPKIFLLTTNHALISDEQFHFYYLFKNKFVSRWWWWWQRSLWGKYYYFFRRWETFVVFLMSFVEWNASWRNFFKKFNFHTLKFNWFFICKMSQCIVWIKI